ncbi:MAG: delta-lactam-biosynthetic de-N-acetylase [Clostridiales bacterium]|nr:delta-lactam-biosynthetic de-N-acetylase [Clostridiales bacterium]
MWYKRRNLFLGTVMLLAVLSLPIFIEVKAQDKTKNPYSKEISLEASVTNDYEQIYRWGLKRGTNGSLPEVGSKEKTLLEKYGGIYLGDTQQKVVYLTFDEGYENGYTPQILDVLKANDVKAIFFITGDYLKQSPELVRRMVEEGHEVGNHTMHHPSLAKVSKERIEDEILGLDREFFDKFNKHMRLLRPPMGEFNEKSLVTANELGHVTVMWSFAYVDWQVNNQKGTQYAHDMVLNNLHNGAVFLLHAVSKDNANALDSIIKDIKAKGYQFGTADQLLGNRKAN